MTFEIHGKKYLLPEKVCTGQDELLAPILTDAIDENKDLLKSFGQTVKAPGPKLAGDKSALGLGAPMLIEATIDLLKVYLWLQSKHYVRKVLAIMLVPEGQEFDPDKVSDLEKEMVHAPREVGLEVLQSFFPKSVGLGMFTPSSSAAGASETRP
jgi:hypothetical protein